MLVIFGEIIFWFVWKFLGKKVVNIFENFQQNTIWATSSKILVLLERFHVFSGIFREKS